MKVAIVGAGITGLTAGYYLGKYGHKVAVFEKDDFPGGLASGIKTEGWYIDRFFHHIFKSDNYIQKLSQDLGFRNLWFWKDSGAPIFYKGKIYPFATPVDLLRFKPLGFSNRLRTGLISAYLLTQRNFRQFESKNARRWLRKWMGKQSFEVIWQPLMRKKFSKKWDKIAMTWMWARIHKRSRFLGYPRGGFQVIVERLVKQIEKNGKIFLNKEIKNIKELINFDKIIFTGAPQIFLQVAPNLPKNYFNKLKQIKYLGTVCILLKLSEQILEKIYWLNVNDEDIPFVVLVQHDNLVSKKYLRDAHWAYIGGYFFQESALFTKNNKEIINQWISYLPRINKHFKSSWIKKAFVFKERYTQPVVGVGYQKIIPSIKTPFKNVYLACMSQVYPWDRGVNYAVKLGKKAAEVVLKKMVV